MGSMERKQYISQSKYIGAVWTELVRGMVKRILAVRGNSRKEVSAPIRDSRKPFAHRLRVGRCRVCKNLVHGFVI